MRSSTVLLFFIGWNILLCSILHLQYDNGQIVSDTQLKQRQLTNSLNKSIQVEQQRAKQSFEQFKYNLDRRPYQYTKPVINAIRSLHQERKVFNHLLSFHDDSTAIRPIYEKIKQQDSLFFKLLDIVLKDKNNKLRKKEIDNIQKENKEKYKIHQSENAFQFNTAHLDNKPDELDLLMIQNDRLSTYFFFEGLFFRYTGYRGCFLRKYFPVINPKQGCVKKGKYFEADIHIGSYYNYFSEANLVINGDTLNYDTKKGVAKYKWKSNKSGINKLNITCTVVNPLTGEKYSSDSSYEYDVQ